MFNEMIICTIKHITNKKADLDNLQPTDWENWTNEVDIGFPLTEIADDTLDGGVLTLLSYDKRPYNNFDLVQYIFDDNTENAHSKWMFIADDGVEIFSKKTMKYKHTICLVELTKILEKFIVPQLSLTSSTDTLYQQLEKACNNIFYTIDGYSPYRFVIAPNVATVFGNQAGEDFSLQDGTSREMLDEIFSAANCRVEVTDYRYIADGDYYQITIDALDYNQVGEDVVFEQNYGEVLSNSCNDVCGGIYTRVSNGVTRKTLREITTLKTTESTLTTDNMALMTSQRIEGVKSLKFSINKTVKLRLFRPLDNMYQDKDWPLADVVVDISDKFFDKEYWDTLTANEKNNSLYYSRNTNSVDASRTYKILFFAKSNLKTVCWNALVSYMNANRNAIIDSIGVSSAEWSIFSNDIEAVLKIDDIANFAIFDIEYYPIIDMPISQHRAAADKFERRLQIFDNQKDNMPEFRRLGKNLGGKLFRTGNTNYCIDDNVRSFTELKPLFGRCKSVFDGETYVIYKREFAYFNTYIGVRYSLSKDYNQLQRKIGTNREKRIYDIPLKGVETLLTVPYRIKCKKPETGDAIAYNATCERFASGLLCATAVDKQKYLDITTKKQDGTTIGRFILNAASFASKDIVHFSAGFYDNYTSGFSIANSPSIFSWIGGKKVSYNPYCDENGEANSLTVSLLDNITFATGNDKYAFYKTLPKIGSGATLSTIKTANLGYKKDREQALKFDVTLQIVGGEDVVIGDAFVENNALYKRDNTQLYLYYSLTGIYENNSNKCLGTKWAYTDLFIAKSTNNEVKLSLNAMVTDLIKRNWKSWAIGDADGNLYIGVNGNDRDIVFNFD